MSEQLTLKDEWEYPGKVERVMFEAPREDAYPDDMLVSGHVAVRSEDPSSPSLSKLQAVDNVLPKARTGRSGIQQPSHQCTFTRIIRRGRRKHRYW